MQFWNGYETLYYYPKGFTALCSGWMGPLPLEKCQSSSVLFTPTIDLSYHANMLILGHNPFHHSGPYLFSYLAFC